MPLPTHQQAPDTETIVTGYQELEKSIQAYYILMAACGIHSSDFFQIFSVPPEERNVRRIRQTDIPGMKSDVIAIEVTKPAGGNWRLECACFPPELEEAVRNFTVIWSPDHYKRTVRQTNDTVAIKDVRQWNFSLILNACWNTFEKPASPEKLNELLTECYRLVNIVHGNIAVCEQNKEFDHETRMKEAIVTYSYAAKEIAESLSLPEYMLKGDTRFASPRMTAEDRAEREKRVLEMLRAKTPSGAYTYTHAQIKKETGIGSRALNTLIAAHHLERGMVGGREKGLPKPRKNKGV